MPNPNEFQRANENLERVAALLEERNWLSHTLLVTTIINAILLLAVFAMFVLGGCSYAGAIRHDAPPTADELQAIHIASRTAVLGCYLDGKLDAADLARVQDACATATEFLDSEAGITEAAKDRLVLMIAGADENLALVLRSAVDILDVYYVEAPLERVMGPNNKRRLRAFVEGVGEGAERALDHLSEEPK
ncbi:MAG: hypothetical protein J7M08_03680 [Planctomycetes bacterium]|nr:hypothetical protein [Planctomycetota bacterium]